jgi:exodeoxyribonuclease VII large subunit
LYKDQVSNLAKSHALQVVKQKMDSARITIQNLREKLSYKTKAQLSNRQQVLSTLSHALEKQDPNEPLQKGFVRVWQNEKWIRKSGSFSENESFELQWADGAKKL